jgi:hypothetical protein
LNFDGQVSILHEEWNADAAYSEWTKKLLENSKMSDWQKLHRKLHGASILDCNAWAVGRRTSGEQKELNEQEMLFGHVAQEAAYGLEKSTQAGITGVQGVK